MDTTLGSFLSPRSVAIVGASPEPHRIRGALLHLLVKNGFSGAIYPVNPSYTEMAGLRCYARTSEVGASIDLALIAIPASGVLAALEDCAAAGVRNAIVISSGFAEDSVAPSDLQAAVAALARRTGMRVSGPNAEGFHNEIDQVTATFSPAVDRETDTAVAASPRRVGILAQSGGMGFALYNRGRALGLSFSQVVTTGNEADLTIADFFTHMARDPATEAILLFLETVRDPAGFMAAAAEAAARRKPVVVVKIGRSTAGKAATASHTASMAGWDAAYEAAFRQFGMVVADDMDQALAAMAALTISPRTRGGRTAVVTVSGGGGAWAADALTAAGLDLPELSAPTQAAIRAFIPSYGATRNPVDLTAGGAQGGGMLRTITLLSEDDAVDQIVVVTSLANEVRVAFDQAELAALLAARRKPVLFYSYTLPSALAHRSLAAAGAMIYLSLAALGFAARALMDQARFVPAAPLTAPPLPDSVQRLLAGPSATEHAAKALLAACGVPIAPFWLVRDPAALADAAADLGFPLAVKIQSPGIPHKTEADGVRLGVTDLDGLHAAFDAVRAGAARHAPDAVIEGVLLEPMARRGVEMIVGVVRDPTFGPVVMVGAGGVTTELFRDVAYRLAPVDEATAAAMVRSLRSAPLLEGFRGAAPADVSALARLIALASGVAASGQATVAELELNPVIVHPAGEGCTVADALLVLSPAQSGA
jgi:acyl-CoA synthetase (NDP forming)